MNSIQKHQTAGLVKSSEKFELAPNLTERQAIVVQNSTAPRVKTQIQTKEGYNSIYDAVALKLQSAVLIAGMKMNAELRPEERHVVVNEIIKVASQYAWLSTADLEFIIDAGLQGEFETEHNKSFSLNARAVNLWIKAYHEQIRMQAMKQQIYFLNQKQLEQEEIIRKQTFEDSKKRNLQKILDHCLNLKLNCETINTMNFGSEVDGQLHSFYITLSAAGKFSQYKDEMKTIWKLETEGVEDMSELTKIKYQKKCRIIFMKHYLASLINEGKDINEHLTNLA